MLYYLIALLIGIYLISMSKRVPQKMDSLQTPKRAVSKFIPVEEDTAGRIPLKLILVPTDETELLGADYTSIFYI